MALDDMLSIYKKTGSSHSALNVTQGTNSMGFLELYNGWFDVCSHISPVNTVDWLDDHLIDLKVTPGNVLDFCFWLNRFQRKPFFTDSGLFISALVRGSSRLGYTSYKIPFINLRKSIDYLGFYTIPKTKKKTNLKIYGSSGNWVARFAGNLSMEFENPVGAWCGARAINCNFIFNKYVGFGCGYEAKDCTFVFNQSVASDCCQGAKDSHIYSPTMEVLSKVRTNAMASCRFYHIQNNKIEEVYF